MATLKYGQSKFKKSNFLTWFFIFSVVFSDVLGNGNLNLLYFFGAFLMIYEFKMKIDFLRDISILFIPFCLMVLGEILFSNNEFSPLKVIIYTIKILVCISLFSYTKNQFWNVDHLKIIDYLCCIFGFILIVSLFTIRLPIFWRLNDSYNSFSKTRLKFLYSEPSVLGILCGLLLVILIYYFFNKKNAVLKEIFLLSLIVLLTFSMSGIVYTAVAVIVLFFFQIFKNTHRIPWRLLLFLIFGIGIFVIVLTTNNPISRRFFSMFLGLDGSYNFRWTAAISTFRKTMEITKNWGMGLGNMNTPAGLSLLLSLGIDYKFANSFLYFFTENGFLGILFVLYLFLVCVYKCIKSSRNVRSLKVGLLVFAFVSQIAGGYFTDPLLWITYGIICSKEFQE